VRALAALLVVLLASGCATRGPRRYTKDACDGAKPRDLVEAMDMLDACVPAEVKEQHRRNEEGSLDHFFGLAGWVRNAWLRGIGPRPLRDELVALGFGHTDDMSDAVMDSWRRRLRGEPLRVEELAAESHARAVESMAEDASERARDAAEASALAPLMLGIGVDLGTGPVIAVAELPATRALRVKALQPWRGGTLVTAFHRRHDQIFADRTSLYWVGPELVVRGVRLENGDDVRAAAVSGDRAWLRADGRTGSSPVVELSSRAVHPVPPPPGEGGLELGTDGEALLAIRPHEVHRLGGSGWASIARSSAELPREAVPPRLVSGRLFFPGWQLSWIEPGVGPTVQRLDADPGWPGHGRKFGYWKTVPGLAVPAGGAAWLNPARYFCCGGESLVRWDGQGYRIALYSGVPRFSEDVRAVSKDAPDFVRPSGLGVSRDGALLVAGPQGIFRLEAETLRRAIGFSNTSQVDPTAFHPGPGSPFADSPPWELVPTQVAEHGAGYLVGTDLGLLFVDPVSRTSRWLDAALGPELRADELAGTTGR